MAQKIRSIELDNGVVVNFHPLGAIEFVHRDSKVVIHDSNLKVIRDTAARNGKIEAGSNEVPVVNKEKVSS